MIYLLSFRYKDNTSFDIIMKIVLKHIFLTNLQRIKQIELIIKHLVLIKSIPVDSKTKPW